MVTAQTTGNGIIDGNNLQQALTTAGLRAIIGFTAALTALLPKMRANHYWVADVFAESILQFKYGVAFTLQKAIKLSQIDLAASMFNGARLDMRLDGLRSLRIAESFAAYKHGMKPIILWKRPDGRYIVLEGNHILCACRAMGIETLWAYVIECDEATAGLITRSWNTVQGFGQKEEDSYTLAVDELTSRGEAAVVLQTIKDVAKIWGLRWKRLQERYRQRLFLNHMFKAKIDGGLGLKPHGHTDCFSERTIEAIMGLNDAEKQRELSEAIMNHGFSWGVVSNIVATSTEGMAAFKAAIVTWTNATSGTSLDGTVVRVRLTEQQRIKKAIDSFAKSLDSMPDDLAKACTASVVMSLRPKLDKILQRCPVIREATYGKY